MTDMIEDVKAFFDKYGVPRRGKPEWPPIDVIDFRIGHLQEEMHELLLAAMDEDMPKFADALADLIYCAIGTALTFGIPLDAVWQEVQAANMRKVRAKPDGSDSKRGHGLDVVKPDGFVGPDIEGALRQDL